MVDPLLGVPLCESFRFNGLAAVHGRRVLIGSTLSCSPSDQQTDEVSHLVRYRQVPEKSPQAYPCGF